MAVKTGVDQETDVFYCAEACRGISHPATKIHRDVPHFQVSGNIQLPLKSKSHNAVRQHSNLTCIPSATEQPRRPQTLAWWPSQQVRPQLSLQDHNTRLSRPIDPPLTHTHLSTVTSDHSSQYHGSGCSRASITSCNQPPAATAHSVYNSQDFGTDRLHIIAASPASRPLSSVASCASNYRALDANIWRPVDLFSSDKLAPTGNTADPAPPYPETNFSHTSFVPFPTKPSLLSTASAGPYSSQMFGVHEGGSAGAGDWKLQSPGQFYKVDDIPELECPSLIGGGDETSPTTPFGCWAPFTPPNQEDSKIALLDNTWRMEESEWINRSASLQGSFLHDYYDGHHAATNTTSCPNLDTWGWSSGTNVADTVVPNQWTGSAAPAMARPVSFPETKLLMESGISKLSHFDPESAATQMFNVGFEMRPETNPERGQIVSGLLSHSFMDDRAAVRAPSETSVTQNEEYDVGVHSPSMMVDGANVLASQRDDEAQDSMSCSTKRRPHGMSANDRDAFLLQARRSGLSYKEIKKRGGFTEAESTLRGRIRILSKPKHERVRKPQWRQADVVLLHRAVAAFTESPLASSRSNAVWADRQSYNAPKPPWKKISEWMQANGASYPFAPSTCAKKWEQVQQRA